MGELFKESFHKLLSLEWNYFEKTLIKKSIFQNIMQKAQTLVKQSVVSQKQSVVYTSKQISKLNFKELGIERMHTDVYTGSL